MLARSLGLQLLMIWLSIWKPDFWSEPVPGPDSLKARYQLGRLLFFDPALSANYKRSCASCHRPQKAFTDQRVLARGFQFGDNLTQNTPTVLNVTDQQAFFHDGRAKDLVSVIGSVITNPAEFNTSYPVVLDRLRSSADYRDLFRLAYGSPVTSQALTSALTVYLRSLNTTHTSFDRWQRRETSIPIAAQTGYQLFNQTLQCQSCHPAPWFRDGRLHQITPEKQVRTPGLRNVLLTPPYLTDGSAPTVEAVLSGSFHRSTLPRPLTDDEQRTLIQFLATLTDSIPLQHVVPRALPSIPNAPPRRIGGVY